MNAKQAKLLKQGAEIFHLPYRKLKAAFTKLTPEEKEKFIKQAEKEVSHVKRPSITRV